MSAFEHPFTVPEPQTRLKKLTKGKWISPFRTASENLNKKNSLKDLQEQNAIDKIQIPKKFTTHTYLDENGKENVVTSEVKSETKSKDEVTDKAELNSDAAAPSLLVMKEGASDKVDTDASIKSLKNEPVQDSIPNTTNAADISSEKILQPSTSLDQKIEEDDEAEAEADLNDAESEKPLNENEVLEPKLESTDVILALKKNLSHEDKTASPEYVTQPKFKSVIKPIENEEVIKSLQDNPVLLGRYHELNDTAKESISRKMDDPNRLVDLGQGLKLPFSQIMEIAARRVHPVLLNINDQVSKTLKDDEIKRKLDYEKQVETEQQGLNKKFNKHQTKLEKQKGIYHNEATKKIGAIQDKFKSNAAAALVFETSTKDDTTKLDTDFKAREAAAVEKHETDKTDLHTKYEELKVSKAKELEDAKTSQVTTTQEIEELTTKHGELIESNETLTIKIQELENELNEKISQLGELNASKDVKQESIDKHTTSIGVINDKFGTKQSSLESKIASHTALVGELNVIKQSVDKYSQKLDELIKDKQDRSVRLADAKQKHQAWEDEKDHMASVHAREQEQQRLKEKAAAEQKAASKAVPVIAAVGAGAAAGAGISSIVSVTPSVPTVDHPVSKTIHTQEHVHSVPHVEEVPKDEISLKKELSGSKDIPHSSIVQDQIPEEPKSISNNEKFISPPLTNNGSRISLDRNGSRSSLSSLKNKLTKKISRNKSKDVLKPARDTESEYDYVTDFEEVSEEEFARHQGHPDYIELTDEEFKRHKDNIAKHL